MHNHSLRINPTVRSLHILQGLHPSAGCAVSTEAAPSMKTRDLDWLSPLPMSLDTSESFSLGALGAKASPDYMTSAFYYRFRDFILISNCLLLWYSI